MPTSLAHKLLARHLVRSGEGADPDALPMAGEEIAVRIDQTLTQDATGTLVMLAFEALGVDRVKTEVSAQYVDHNLIQADHKNPDDHLFLESAARKFGLQFAPPGSGVSHAVHMQRFGRPGASLLGSDSHTPAAGSMGMLAMGAGGLDVALAMAGEPYRMRMPKVIGVELTGALPEWVSAKDVILEMLRRHGVRGAVGAILEYHGPGLAALSAMDRHVIANMGTELGATTTVFPSDDVTRAYLEAQGRADVFEPIAADPGATYDDEDAIDLSALVPLIAKPSSPGNVVEVRELEGEPLYQAYIGSSANPGWRDFAIVAEIVDGQPVPSDVSLDVNPTSRQLLSQLLESGHLGKLIAAGARLHQPGCNGCIGMGQAPASGRNSLRTVPRNFADRSGTVEDSVFLCSPETAAASAVRGTITDPRDLDRPYPALKEPRCPPTDLRAPPAETGTHVELVKGPNVGAMPALEPLPDTLELEVLLSLEDDVSTDAILPAGTDILPYRSNLEKISEFCFRHVDPEYAANARARDGGHAIVAGDNYGQGSSREHAAIAPRILGLRAVVAKSFARIHRNNLVNFGVLPLTFDGDAPDVSRGATLRVEGLDGLAEGETLEARLGDEGVTLAHDLSAREVEIVKAGGRVAHFKASR